MARNLHAAESDNDRARRVAKATEGLLDALDRLESVVGAITTLRERGVEVPLEGLDRGFDTFEKRSAAATGLPTPEEVNGAKNTVVNVVTRLGTELEKHWSMWSSDRSQALEWDFERRHVQQPAEISAIRRSMDDVKRVAKIKTPTGEEIKKFAELFDTLSARFAALPEIKLEARVLLDELRGGKLLDEISDYQIALLREQGLGNIIEVRRKDR
ncbi:hypothetical protein [Nocardia wallacei]|uniref:hypothetical protein n=1 Tax=Nocardia wallacei TaxID=480035 RepID=UPI002457F281|nr:hypothetical protein [Nocardia wallacei]